MTAPGLITRRDSLALLSAAVALPVLSRPGFGAPMHALSLFGPPATPSVTLANAVAQGAFEGVADNTGFRAWRNPDELRAGLTSGEIALSIVPVQAAANLYNRGFPIRLANVMTDGLLYVISAQPDIVSITDLAGRTVAVPFRGDTPEIILGQLLRHNGLDPDTDLSITYTGSPIEAMQLLLAGRVEASLTAEPSTTAGVLRGAEAGQPVRRAIDIQQAWGEMTGAASVLPQAGLAVTQVFTETYGEALPAILSAIESTTAAVLDDPRAAARSATEALGLPAPVLAASIPHSNLVARMASSARGDIEEMLAAAAGTDLARIGGRLPDDGFYL